MGGWRHSPPVGRAGFATSPAGLVTIQPMARSRRRWRHWLWRIGGLGLLGVLVGGGVVIGQGPWLRVAEVVVVGNAAVPAILVQDQVNVLGHSMLSLDTEAAAQRVAALPRIEHATVERFWPRQVRVTVAERQPLAVWSQAGKSYLVDPQGYVLSQGSAPGLWQIKSLDPQPLSERERVDPGAVRLAQRLVEAVPVRLGVPVQGFEYVQRAGLVVITSRGRARFDTDDDFDYKLAVWQAVLAQAARERLTVSHVDLRFGTRPFLR